MNKNEQDISFSPLIIGTMRLGAWGANMETEELENFIDRCIDLGLRDFDHADIYGHYTEEANFGRVIKRRPDLKSKIQITTKCGIKLLSDNRPGHKIKSYDSTGKHLLRSVDHSLSALGVERIDVLLIHRPDFLMDVQEIAETFALLQKNGKVKAFGVSNFTASQFDLLNSFCPLVTNQIEISLMRLKALEDGTLDQCQKLGLTPTAWSPLGGGEIFSEKPSARAKRIRSVATELAQKHNASLDQIMLSWLLKHPAGIVPVLGTSKISRIESAVQALSLQLTHEEWYELLEASIGEEVA